MRSEPLRDNDPQRMRDDAEDRLSRLSREGRADPLTDEMKPKRKRDWGVGTRTLPLSYSRYDVSQDERTWAAAAHAAAWITLIGGLLTGGALLPIAVFVPLGVYFAFRQRSDYVAFHALQAFVMQLIGTLGAMLLLIVGGIVWLVGLLIAAVSSVILVGVVLTPLWLLLGLVMLMMVIGLPIALLVFSTIAAVETSRGRDYRAPLIARWIDAQMSGGFLSQM